ncbi:MAG: anti-sigma factor family protein [bacterium]
MDHDDALRFIPDLAAGRLDAARAADIEHHAAACPACGEALELHRRIAAEVSTHRGALFEDHIAPTLLVEFALDPAAVSSADRARVAAHVGACPTCRREAASVRKAEADATSAWRSAVAWLGGGAWPAPIPALVPALMVLLLAYPAYLGVVRLPQVARECDLAREQLSALGGSGAGWLGGPVLALNLPAPARGDEEDPPALPVIRILAGQRFQPVRIEYDPSTAPAAAPLIVTLRAKDDERARWRIESTAAALWDASDEAINLLLPAERLGPGEFVLEIHEAESASAVYASGFRVVDASLPPEGGPIR